MPRRSVPLLNGYFYHVYNRTSQNKKLFYSKENYRYFIQLWVNVHFKPCCRIAAWCLMPNHYHFVLKIIDAELFPKKMSYFFNRYCRALNIQCNQSGAVFPDRYKTRLVIDEKYLISLCCYVHLNPVRSKWVASPGEWPYSNYLSCIGVYDDPIADQALFTANILNGRDYEEFLLNQYDESELGDYI